MKQGVIYSIFILVILFVGCNQIFSQDRITEIDNKVRSYAIDDMDLKETNANLDQMYKDLGTFGITADMQQYIDEEALKGILKKYLKDNKYDYNEGVKRIEENRSDNSFYDFICVIITETESIIHEDINKEEDEILYVGYVPTFEQVDNFYNNYFQNVVDPELKKDYEESIIKFKKKQKTKDTTRALSILLAYRIYTQDRIIIRHIFKELFNESSDDGFLFKPISIEEQKKFFKYLDEFEKDANPENYISKPYI